MEELWTQHDIDTFKPTPNAPRMPRKSAPKSAKKSEKVVSLKNTCKSIGTAKDATEAKKVVETTPGAVAIDSCALAALMGVIGTTATFSYGVNGTVYDDVLFEELSMYLLKNRNTSLNDTTVEDVIDIIRLMFTNNPVLPLALTFIFENSHKDGKLSTDKKDTIIKLVNTLKEQKIET